MRLALALLLASVAGAQDWQPWSPRDEIAPQLTRGASGELISSGAGNPSVFGGWERVFPNVTAGHWYHLEVRYRASGLTYEPSQIPVRLDWLRAGGDRAGQPDYASRVSGDDWRTVTLDAPAPEAATQVKVQLLLQNAPNAHVEWKDVSFTPIDAPAARPVRIAALRLRPSGSNPVERFAA